MSHCEMCAGSGSSADRRELGILKQKSVNFSEGYRYIKREGSTKLEFDEKKGSASKERKA